MEVRYDRQLQRRAYRIKPAIHYRSLGDWFENFEITSSKVVNADYQVLIMKQIGNYRKLIIIVNSCLYGCYEASWAYRKNLSQVQQHRLRLDSQQGQILDATCKKRRFGGLGLFVRKRLKALQKSLESWLESKYAFANPLKNGNIVMGRKGFNTVIVDLYQSK